MKKKEEDLDLNELGEFYFLNKKFEKSIEVFNKILKKDPGNIDAIYNLGLNCEAINDFDKAKSFYKRTLEIRSDHKLAKEHLNKMFAREV